MSGGNKYSDATQKAALNVAKRAILFNERPSQSQREMVADQLDDIAARIDRAAAVKEARTASQKERQSDVGDVRREETRRR
jgi:hypothetical protein